MLDKDQKDKYYVYLHRKKDTHQIFYVGKGKDKRHLSRSGRNLHWKNTVLKHDYYSVKVQEFLSEENALELEEFLIQEIGLLNLCNKNYFNGGKSGYNHSENSKLKMSISKKGNIPWNKGKLCPESSIRMKGVCNPMFGKKKIHSKKTIESLIIKNGTPTCDLFTGIFYDSLEDMSRALNIGRKTREFKNRAYRE